MVDPGMNGGDALPPAIVIDVVDQDGAVFELRCQIGEIQLEVIAELELSGDDLFAWGMHIGGPGRGTLSPRLLRAAARELGRQWNARRVIIEGGIRTTGANPGHKPRRIIISVDD
jgi:hypothetical protein